MSWLLASDGQSIEVSASASVFPMNIQGWFSVGLTGLISLLSERLSRVFCSTTVWKYKFFGIQPSLKICLKFRRPGFNSWVNKMTWRRKQQPTPVFLPGESHGRGAWWAIVHGVAKESDTTWWLNNNKDWNSCPDFPFSHGLDVGFFLILQTFEEYPFEEFILT